jgi:hypothetical protein
MFINFEELCIPRLIKYFEINNINKTIKGNIIILKIIKIIVPILFSFKFLEVDTIIIFIIVQNELITKR